MNFVDFVFINFTFVITILGALINLSEPYLPAIILQTFRYGKHSYKGHPSKLVQLCEIPKSYFRHFYVAALGWSVLALATVTTAYVFQSKVPSFIIWTLDLLCGSNRIARTNSTTTFIAIVLLCVQCIKRFYETHFVQVFSKSSKINITHYIVGHLHYIGAFLTVLSRADGFVSVLAHQAKLSFDHLNAMQWLGVALFLYACLYQYKSNMILANLRKNKSGKVISEKHSIPEGGYFDYISSPHMLFEVVMYASLCLILQNNYSSLFILLWVLTNQVENAWLTHKWYKESFPQYPKKRKVIFPGLL